MRYNKRQKDERRALARRFEQSELSKTDYARQHGLSVNSLNYWIGEATKEESRGKRCSGLEIFEFREGIFSFVINDRR